MNASTFEVIKDKFEYDIYIALYAAPTRLYGIVLDPKIAGKVEVIIWLGEEEVRGVL